MDKLFTSIQQSIHKGYVKTVEKVTPALSTSKYLEEGVLTPDEVCVAVCWDVRFITLYQFVIAGDLLTFKCPTWSWYVSRFVIV